MAVAGDAVHAAQGRRSASDEEYRGRDDRRQRRLYPARERFRRLAWLPRGDVFERLDAARAVEMDDHVELLRQAGVEVVTRAFRLRPIDDADRAFQSGLREQRMHIRAALDRQEETIDARFVKQRLVASGQRR